MRIKKEHVSRALLSQLLTLVLRKEVIPLPSVQIDAVLNSRSRIVAIRVVVGSVALRYGCRDVLGLATFILGRCFRTSCRIPLAIFLVDNVEEYFRDRRDHRIDAAAPVLFLVVGMS